jgi:hypothetical protein
MFKKTAEASYYIPADFSSCECGWIKSQQWASVASVTPGPLGPSGLVVLAEDIDLWIASGADDHLKTDWPAADLAVLDVVLLFFRAIDQYLNSLTAIGTMDTLFRKPRHGCSVFVGLAGIVNSL